LIDTGGRVDQPMTSDGLPPPQSAAAGVVASGHQGEPPTSRQYVANQSPGAVTQPANHSLPAKPSTSARLSGAMPPPYEVSVLLLLDEIALERAISPIATHFFIAWSVCRLSHSCILLKTLDGFGCRSAVTHCVKLTSLPPGRFGEVERPSRSLYLFTYDSAGVSTDQRFRVLPKLLGHLCLIGFNPRRLKASQR